MSVSQLFSASKQELIRLIYDLIDENQALKAQIAELQNSLKEKGDGKPKQPPSFVKANAPLREKKNRKKREVNFARKKGAPDQTVFHSFEVCPDCGGSLGKPAVSYSREIIDVPLPKAVISQHIIFKRWCLHCKKRVAPRVNFSSLVVGQQRIGLNLVGLVSVLRERLNQPLNVIQSYLQLVHKLSLSEGELVTVLDTVANKGKPEYEEIKTSVQRSLVVHADETSHRENGRNGYTWNFSTDQNQLVLYRRTRSKKVVKEALNISDEGAGFDGIIVSDFYTAYNEHAGFHQRCWAHLLRDIHELKEKATEDSSPYQKEVICWAQEVEQIFNQAKDYTGPPTTTPPGLEAQLRIQKEAEFKEKLKIVCEPYLTKEFPQSTLCGRITKYLPELFTFVRFANVPATNNKAERDIRHLVVQRKIFGGTRSEKGTKTQEILATLFGTWHLRELDPLEQTRLLLVRSPCQ